MKNYKIIKEDSTILVKYENETKIYAKRNTVGEDKAHEYFIYNYQRYEWSFITDRCYKLEISNKTRKLVKHRISRDLYHSILNNCFAFLNKEVEEIEKIINKQDEEMNNIDEKLQELDNCYKELEKNHTKNDMAQALIEYDRLVKNIAKDYTDETTIQEIRDEIPELDYMDNEEIKRLLNIAKKIRNETENKEILEETNQDEEENKQDEEVKEETNITEEVKKDKSKKKISQTNNELVIIDKNNILYVDSRDVAEVTEIRHADLLRKITKYEEVLLNAKLRSVNYFKKSNYIDSSGKENRCYLLTKKGCDMVANKMTGDKGIIFTAKYIDRFYQMEQLLRERQTQLWQNTRIDSKSNRLNETDEIKLLVEYAKANGSKNADKYYITFSNLANKSVGLDSKQRDIATTSQLNNLILIENIINHVIKEGLEKQLYYKDIYKSCKERIEQFKYIAYLGQIA